MKINTSCGSADPIYYRGKNGIETTGYNRLFVKTGLGRKDGICCVAVLAVSKEKKYLVNLIFRHPTRNWEIELPRGGIDQGKTPWKVALKELVVRKYNRGLLSL